MAKTNTAGVAGRGGARRSSVGSGAAGEAWHDEVGQGSAGLGAAGEAGLGAARSGTARLGKAAQARHGNGDGGLVALSVSPPTTVRITPPNFKLVKLKIAGTGPYVQHAFSQKARTKMEETQRAGSRSRTRKTREARNFEEDFEQAQHRSEDGWRGIPASAFRNAMISACKIVGFFQTRAKLAIFVIADGLDAIDGTPLIKITGDPETHQGYARNESGVADLRWRPMWREWGATVVIEFDADMLSEVDITNLLMRAGTQIGIGEGRPDSPNSNGLGWGTFEVLP